MFISSMWDVKEPTNYSKRVGHEVPSVVAVLCECLGGYREVNYLAWNIESRLYITLHSCANAGQKNVYNLRVNYPKGSKSAIHMAAIVVNMC